MNPTSPRNTPYRGWDAEPVRERSDGHVTESIALPASSSFTAINQPQTQLLTPQSSVIGPVQQYQAQRRPNRTTKRKRNPTVARYLGLGSSGEPTRLDKYVATPDRSQTHQPASRRKRQRQGDAEVRIDDPGRVSESLEVDRSRRKATVCAKPPATDTSLSNGSSGLKAHAPGSQPTHMPQDTSFPITHETVARRDTAFSTEEPGKTTRSRTTTQPSELNVIDHHAKEHGQHRVNGSIFDDEEFCDDLNDDDFIQLTADMIDVDTSIDGFRSSFSTSPSKDSISPSTYNTEQCPDSSAHNLSAPKSEESSAKLISKKFVSPVTLTTRLLGATGDIDSIEARKPIVRSPFPSAVRDRSPIIGLSSNSLLRSCFRVGEAINQAHQASKSGTNVVFELYARILESNRDNTKQHFTLCDLFHGKPPYIRAEYDAAIWRSAPLFEYDSRRLLQQGRMCRCMGRMKRQGKEWLMTVLNIFEATWDDVKWVEGVVNS